MIDAERAVVSPQKTTRRLTPEEAREGAWRTARLKRPGYLEDAGNRHFWTSAGLEEVAVPWAHGCVSPGAERRSCRLKAHERVTT
jgi:hypothetical protein